MRIPFGVQSYQHTSLPLSAQRLVNSYLEPGPPQAKTDAAVIASFGVTSEGVVGSNHRGARVVRGKVYCVSGETLYRINADLSATALGTVPGHSPVFISGDEQNLLIVTNPDGYYYNGTVVAKCVTGWPGAVWCDSLHGYHLIIKPNSGQFYTTANRDPSTVDELEFASAESYPDDLVTGVVDHEEFIGFGTESFEGFYDSGATDFPISKIQSATGEVGCTARRGVGKLDNTAFFPGSDGKVYRLNGYTPQAISTPVVEQAIEKATDRDFQALVWKEPGHAFYGLRCADFFFVYDISTNLWHEKTSQWAWIVRCYDRWIVADATSGKIGYLSATTFREFDRPLICSATSPPVGDDNKRVVHSRVELVFEQGVGLATGQGADPQVMLQFSDDGGRTWSNEKWRSLGRIGEYKRRAIWNRLGQARDRIYRYSISDPVRRTLLFATTEAVGGG